MRNKIQFTQCSCDINMKCGMCKVLLLCLTYGKTKIFQLGINETNSITNDLLLSQDDFLEISYTGDPKNVMFERSTLYRIPEGVFSKDTITWFSASKASIAEIDPKNFTNAINLQMLELPYNLLTKIKNSTFALAAKLEFINLAFNNIVEIEAGAFHGLNHVKTLFLNGNQIKNLPLNVFAAMPLLSLDLSNNYLSNIKYSYFFNLTSLETLFLENNRISNLNLDTLVPLKSLKTLYLNNNKFVSLDLTDAGYILPSLTDISLTNNEWACTHLAQIIKNLRRFSIEFYDKEVGVKNKILLNGVTCKE